MKVPHEKSVHDVLRQIPYGVFVVGINGRNNELNALVVSWATQCSFEPPMILIAIRVPSRSNDLIQEGRAFTLNLLERGDSELVRQLVKPSDRVGDKLSGVSHSAQETGAPILEQALGYVECRVHEIHQPGDHALVIGDVLQGDWRRDGTPLVCSDLGWHYAG